MLHDPTFWVAVAFVLFFGVVFYFRIPAMAVKALDDRAAQITAELDEARRLREEAQAIYADFERKQRDAEKEAENIITQAEHEATVLAEETKLKLDEMLARRTAQVEDKITRAENSAIDEVRNAAAEAAIKAARKIIAESLTPAKSDHLIEAGIKDIKTRLN